ncbi:MAG: dihydroxyacetone kinase subunit DhaK [Chloroflexota bacterium]
MDGLGLGCSSAPPSRAPACGRQRSTRRCTSDAASDRGRGRRGGLQQRGPGSRRSRPRGARGGAGRGVPLAADAAALRTASTPRWVTCERGWWSCSSCRGPSHDPHPRWRARLQGSLPRGAHGRLPALSPTGPGCLGGHGGRPPIPGQVSVIIGGGSGHYPAFAGLVGPGLCHGAVVGDVFTSPSATQAHRAIEALDGGAGVLLAFGNYSGDVMHFGLAAEQARAAGIDTRIVLVTDDVASRPVAESGQRRGIAGGFFVFRAAAAAARRGDELGAVERIARHANDRTRTLGIALAGCTFPGRREPLFTADLDSIAVGLGIHGEPGIQTVPWCRRASWRPSCWSRCSRSACSAPPAPASS